MKKRSRLTGLQQRFAYEFLKDQNPNQAAIRAGSKAAANTNPGHQMLRVPKVAAEIVRLREEISDVHIAGVRECAAGLSEIIRANFVDFLEVSSTEELRKCPNLAAIKSITRQVDLEGNVSFKYELHDKIKAAERLAKLMGWDKPKLVEKKVDVNVVVPNSVKMLN